MLAEGGVRPASSEGAHVSRRAIETRHGTRLSQGWCVVLISSACTASVHLRCWQVTPPVDSYVWEQARTPPWLHGVSAECALPPSSVHAGGLSHSASLSVNVWFRDMSGGFRALRQQLSSGVYVRTGDAHVMHARNVYASANFAKRASPKERAPHRPPRCQLDVMCNCELAENVTHPNHTM